MKVLLVTPPMTQLNTPYPATAYLKGFLGGHEARLGLRVSQADASLELALRLFSRAGLKRAFSVMRKRFGKQPSRRLPPSVAFFLESFDHVTSAVEPAIRFLQGKDSTLALRLASGDFLPRGPLFQKLYFERGDWSEASQELLQWGFGGLGVQDRAKHFASLFIDDVAAAVKDGVDAKFELSKYGERLAASAGSFEALQTSLDGPRTLIDELIDEIAVDYLKRFQPDLVGFSVPFPGNVYGALRLAKTMRGENRRLVTVIGGGYCNTELRRLDEPRLFDYVDYVTMDDGEQPFAALLEHLSGQRGQDELVRTYRRTDDAQGVKVVFSPGAAPDGPSMSDLPAPSYAGLDLTSYLSMSEMLNPMHRIWSDGRWNKLTLAHGCYWRKCSFCDVTLDYIGRYEEQTAERLVDKMEAMIAATGQSGFHFVDEAAPPKMLFAMAREITRRSLAVSWWGNIRFERTFTPELCLALAESGCIAVSGGLEVASDRLLRLMNKGVTVEQVARVAKGFADAGVLVHAYLMYGFPTQTEQETIDALERVRQLFDEGCIHSAFWHRFAATVHSPIGKDPERFGIELLPRAFQGFAENDLDFRDPIGCDHDRLSGGLNKAIYNYMHGVALDDDVREFFEFPVPKPKVPRRLIAQAVGTQGPKP